MDLGFQKIALSAFSFLESTYNYRCVESGPWRLRYESSKVFVLIIFDGTRSYEIGCAIGRIDNFKGSRQVPFDLGEVIRAEGITNEKASFQVTTSKALEKFTRQLAEQLEKYGKKILVGGDAPFNRVAAFRDNESSEYAAEKRLKQVRRSLEVAWRSRDYQTVIKLLAPVQEWLVPSEVKKLEYARKQVC